MKRSPITRRTCKIAIGKFYIAIDTNLLRKGSRPDNVYRFIENISQSQSDQSHQLMNYGNIQERVWRRQELKEMKSEVDACNQKVEQMT